MVNSHAKPIKILIRQLLEDIQVDVVFSKALRLHGHAELIEPVRNPFHRGHQGPVVAL